MLAARLPSILPPLSPSELLEVSMIASVAGEIRDGALTARRPFRSPHHSASMAVIIILAELTGTLLIIKYQMFQCANRSPFPSVELGGVWVLMYIMGNCTSEKCHGSKPPNGGPDQPLR